MVKQGVSVIILAVYGGPQYTQLVWKRQHEKNARILEQQLFAGSHWPKWFSSKDIDSNRCDNKSNGYVW